MITSGFIKLKHNNNKYIFDYDNVSIIRIDDKVEKILNLMQEYEWEELENKSSIYMPKQEYRKLIESMKSMGFLREAEFEDKQHYDSSNKISSITLMLIQGCNLACKYCFGDEGRYNHTGFMDLNTAKQSIDFLIENTNSDKLNIIFFGGEPLLRFDLIKEIVNYCKIKESTNKLKFYFSMTTNGTLLNKEVNEFIIENKINTMISIDGDLNDNSDRVYQNGNQAYNDIIENTLYLRNKGLLSARATITPRNLDMVRVFEHLNTLNFRNIPISAADNSLGTLEYKGYIDENINLINQFKDYIKNGEIDKAKKVKILFRALKQIHFSKKQNYPCGAAFNSVAIDIDGNIYPCHRFVSYDHYNIGNVYSNCMQTSNFIKKIFNDNSKLTECSSCFAKHFCRCGCPYENYENTGILNRPSSRQCYLNKVIFMKLLYLYIDLSDSEIKALFE